MPGSTAAINTGGKKHFLQGRNKAERNCRRTQGVPHIKKKRPDKIGTLFWEIVRVLFAPHTPQIKKKTPPNCDMSPQYWVSSIGGTYRVLRAFFAYCSVCTQNSISGAFNLFSDHAFQFLRDGCTICNTVIPEIRNTFALFHGQIAVDQKQAF